MASGSFGTAINCMDGRTQLPVISWVKTNFYVNYVDMITEAGAEGIMAHGSAAAIESIRQRALISVNKHGSHVIALVAHHDCAGNPVSKEQHLADVRAGMRAIGEWSLPVQVVGLWVDERGEVETVSP